MKTNSKHVCKFCGKEFEKKQSLGAHIVHCKLNPNNHIKDFANRKSNKAKELNPAIEYHLICENCGKEYTILEKKNNFEQGKYKHTCSDVCAKELTVKKTNKSEKNKKISCSLKGKEYVKAKIAICKQCGKMFINDKKLKMGKFRNVSFCSEECRHKCFSNLAKDVEFGGYHENAIKKHKHGNYRGIHCDSSWELAYVVYNLEHGIPIKRCKEKRKYTINGIEKTYSPDFVVGNNQIVEIKGYDDVFSKAKREQNKDIVFLFKKDLQYIINYSVEKYGKRFWEKLYE